MYRVTYTSIADPARGWSAIDAILVSSRDNNRRDGITGILVHDGRRFLQVLEGRRDVVEAAFTRIRDDPRHGDVRLLESQDIVERSFGCWDMACEEVSTLEDERSFGDRLSRIAADVRDLALHGRILDFGQRQPA